MDFLSHIAKKLTAVLLSLSLIVGLALTSAAAPNANNGNGRPKYNTTQVIVKYKDPSQSAATDQRVRGNVGHIKNIKSLSNNGNHNGATQGNSPGNGNLATLASLSLVQTDSVDNMDAVMNAYDTDPNVLYAAPNYQMSLFEADPLFDQQWMLGSADWSGDQSGDPQADTVGLDTVSAWDIADGANVTVAVIDTGVDVTHEDLAANIDPRGYNFLDNNTDVYSSAASDTHGTEVAGILAAGINGVGIEGVAPKAHILPLKVSDGSTLYTSDVIDAIEYAKSLGIRIVNMSFGSSDYNVALKDEMASSDMLFICAAGNTSTDTTCYPAGFALNNIVSVGAVDKQGNITDFTATGSHCDVYAPGQDILTTTPGNNYSEATGTSFAAPFVTGAAALILSAVPNISVAGLRLSLIAGVTKKGDNAIGVTNTYAALKLALPLKYVDDSDGRIARAMTYSGSLIIPDIAEIFTKYTQYSQLDASQEAIVQAYFNATDAQLTQGESLGLDILYSGILACVSNLLQISIDDAYALSHAYDGMFPEAPISVTGAPSTATADAAKLFDAEVQGLKSWLDRGMLDTTAKADVFGLMLQGNRLSSIESAYIVSQVTGTALDTVIFDDLTTYTPCAAFTDPNENAVFDILAGQYGVAAAPVLDWLQANSLQPSQLQAQLEAWQQTNNFYIINGELSLCAVVSGLSATQTQSLLAGGISKYNTNTNGSWSDGISSIDQITGEMSYSQNLLNLSGRNGLNLNLNLNFDGQVNDAGSTVQQPLSADELDLTKTITYYSTAGAVTSTSTSTSYIFASQGDWGLSGDGALTYYSGTQTIYSKTSLTLTATNQNTPNNTTTYRDNFYNSIYDLGAGINLGLPVIEKIDDLGSMIGTYLHLPDGSKYRIYGNSLSGYYMADTAFKTGATTFITNNDAYYTFTTSDNTVYYFDVNGRYLGCKDAYNNKIQVNYNASGYIDKIIDTAGRYVQFVYSGDGNTDHTVKMYLHDTGDANGQLLYTFNVAGSDKGSPYLQSVTQTVTDSQNRTTTFGVSYVAQNYYMNSRSPSGAQSPITGNYAVCINSITAPTGMVYNYAYTTGKKNYGAASTRDCFRVSETYCSDPAQPGTKLNDATYAYSRTLSAAAQLYPLTITDTNYQIVNGIKDQVKYVNLTLSQETQIDVTDSKKAVTLSTVTITSDPVTLLPATIITKTFDNGNSNSFTTVKTTNAYDTYGRVTSTNTVDMNPTGNTATNTQQDIAYTYSGSCPVPLTVTTRQPDETDNSGTLYQLYQYTTNTVDTTHCKLTASTVAVEKTSGSANLSSISLVNQSTTSITYDAWGNTQSTSTTDFTVTPPAAQTVTNTYDSTYHIYIASTSSGALHDVDGSPIGTVSSGTAIYDMFGRVASSTDQMGRTTSYQYNQIGAVTKTTAPDGSYTTVDYDYTNHITTTTSYDATGAIEGGSRVTADAAGNTVRTERVNKAYTTPAAQPSSSYPASLQNASFETQTPAYPVTPAASNINPISTVPGWFTTAADGAIELWANGFHPGTGANKNNPGDISFYTPFGSWFAEINANVAGSLYQDVSTQPGALYQWSFWHRGRTGVDTAMMLLGAPSQTDATGLLPSATYAQPDLTGATALTAGYGATNTASSTPAQIQANWTQHTGCYTVPAGQTVTRFQLYASASASGNISMGNLVDNAAWTLIAAPTKQYIHVGSPTPAAASLAVCAPGYTAAYADPDDHDGILLGQQVPGDYSVKVAIADSTGAVIGYVTAEVIVLNYNTVNEYTYDTQGNLLTEKDYLSEDGAAFNLTANTYDSLGRLTDTVTKDQTGTVLSEETTAYLSAQTYHSGKPDANKYTKVTVSDLVGYSGTTPIWSVTVSYLDQEGATHYTDFFGTNAPNTTGVGALITTNDYSTPPTGVGSMSALNVTKTDSSNTTQTTALATTNQSQSKVTTENGTSTANSTNISNTINYNGFGTQSSSVDGNGYTTTYTYDEAGRLVNTASPFSGTPASYTCSNQKTYYNPDGSVAETRQQTAASAWAVTRYTYDNMGRTVMVESVGDAASGATHSQFTQYLYDPRGQLVKTVSGLTSPLSPEDLAAASPSPANPYSVTLTAYDFYGNVTSSTDADGNVTSFTYNELTGQLLTKTAPGGGVITYTYDARGSVILETATSPNSPTLTQSWAYNTAGQLTSATDSNGIATAYSYDAYGRLASESYTQSGGAVVKAYTYDVDGNVRTVDITVNGAERSYQTFSYNDNGKVYSGFEFTSQQYATFGYGYYYTYDNNGNVTEMNAAEGSVSPQLGECRRYTYTPAIRWPVNRISPLSIPCPAQRPPGRRTTPTVTTAS